jgi:hypothetical protein
LKITAGLEIYMVKMLTGYRNKPAFISGLKEVRFKGVYKGNVQWINIFGSLG